MPSLPLVQLVVRVGSPRLIGLSAPVYGPSRAAKAPALGLNDNSLGDEYSTRVLAQYDDFTNKPPKILTGFIRHPVPKYAVHYSFMTAGPLK
jgi:hypothetical protein